MSIVNFDDIYQNINTLDIILIKGGLINDYVIYAGYLINQEYNNYNSHVLLCFRGDSFSKDSIYYSTKKIYTLESNIDIGGVQLVDLYERMKQLKKVASSFSLLRWGILKNKQLIDNSEIINKNELLTIDPVLLESLINKYKKYSYETNIIAQGAGLFTLIKPFRDLIYKTRSVLEMQPRINCSQLVAKFLYDSQLIDINCDPNDIIPIDFISKKNNITNCWVKPIYFEI